MLNFVISSIMSILYSFSRTLSYSRSSSSRRGVRENSEYILRIWAFSECKHSIHQWSMHAYVNYTTLPYHAANLWEIQLLDCNLLKRRSRIDARLNEGKLDSNLDECNWNSDQRKLEWIWNECKQVNKKRQAAERPKHGFLVMRLSFWLSSPSISGEVWCDSDNGQITPSFRSFYGAELESMSLMNE